MNTQLVYIYALINPINNEVFYVGATINPHTRFLSHINSMSQCSTKRQKIIDDLICKEKVEPEMFILDTSSIEDAGFWEIFYTDLYRSFGFKLEKCRVPYKWIERNRGMRVSKFKGDNSVNNISGIIDGKDIHYYRREVFRNFKFYQHT